jgi:collagen triple helix repeat protein
MRFDSNRSSVRKRVLATALAFVVLSAAGSVAPALGFTDPSAKALKIAQQALRVAKRAKGSSTHALKIVRRSGPTGPAGPRGSEGLDGRQGADGAPGARGAPGPTGPQGPTGANGTSGTNGTNGAEGATGPTGPRGLQGPTGHARAFATVRPDTVAVVTSRSLGVSAVSRPADDRYCLSVPDVDVTTTSPIVSVDLGLSTGGTASLSAAVDSTGGGCAAGQIAVVTAGSAPNAAAFTILVP